MCVCVCVCVCISGNTTKKYIKGLNCEDCKIRLLSNENTIEDGGGLLIPSSNVCTHSITCYAILNDVLIKHVPNNIKNSTFAGVYSSLIEFCSPTLQVVSGWGELFPIYILMMYKISQMQKFERMI